RDWDKWAEAQAMARRAEALLGDGEGDSSLVQQVDSLLCDMAKEAKVRRLLADLDDIRLARDRSLPQLHAAFAGFGLTHATKTPEDAADAVRRLWPSAFGPVVAALDHWLILARLASAPETVWLERVLAISDRNPWRKEVRAARARNDRAALERLA